MLACLLVVKRRKETSLFIFVIITAVNAKGYVVCARVRLSIVSRPTATIIVLTLVSCAIKNYKYEYLLSFPVVITHRTDWLIVVARPRLLKSTIPLIIIILVLLESDRFSGAFQNPAPNIRPWQSCVSLFVPFSAAQVVHLCFYCGYYDISL